MQSLYDNRGGEKDNSRLKIIKTSIFKIQES
jgi:hypothetical protein